jgi:hypothetical protein
MTVKEYLESTFKPYGDGYHTRNRVKCADGFSISIQGGTKAHYCSPREHCNEYNRVELGFPSKRMPTLNEYAEDPKRHTKTIFGFVPLEEVEAVIASHGGIVEEVTA